SNPHDPVISPTGHEDWSAFVKWDAQESGGRIEALPIRVLKGDHRSANRGFGLEHISLKRKMETWSNIHK
ncbi:MAG: hypothetical protein WCL11_28080, partial [Verrucomicrobiota bacterium]